MGFQKIRGFLFGVPRMRMIVFLGSTSGPLIFANFHAPKSLQRLLSFQSLLGGCLKVVLMGRVVIRYTRIIVIIVVTMLIAIVIIALQFLCLDRGLRGHESWPSRGGVPRQERGEK